MPTHRPADQPATVVSPYLFLRQAVRPLIYVHALLSREQQQAKELVEECSRLRHLTEELLGAVALAHLHAPSESAEVGASAVDIGRPQFINAFAQVGLMWAQVTGSALAVADVLLHEARWDEVHRLANFLEDAGEHAAAEDLRNLADAGARKANEARLAQIHSTMTEPEIAAAIEALRDSKNAKIVGFYMRDVSLAMSRILPPSWREEYQPISGQGTIKWQVKPGDLARKDQAVLSWTIPKQHTGYDTLNIQISFWAIISELLVADGSAVTGPLAYVIKIPDPIADELETDQPRTEEALDRLDTLARVFRRIKTEIERPAAKTV
jgi:hypothetical protein